MVRDSTNCIINASQGSYNHSRRMANCTDLCLDDYPSQIYFQSNDEELGFSKVDSRGTKEDSSPQSPSSQTVIQIPVESQSAAPLAAAVSSMSVLDFKDPSYIINRILIILTGLEIGICYKSHDPVPDRVPNRFMSAFSDHQILCRHCHYHRICFLK